MELARSPAAAPLFPAECAASQLAAFVTLLVSVINAGQESERRRRAALSATGGGLGDAQEYDVVVVGGGTAGCVLAARLSEDGRRRVLLLERGGTQPAEATVPGYAVANLRSELVQNLQAAAEPQNCNATGCALQVPRVLGGGSSVNGLMVIRGNDADYDQWAELTGDSSWNHTNMLRYFKRAEDNLDVAINWDTDFHSTGGPQKVSWQPYRHPVLRAFAKAYDDLGTPSILDINGGQGQLGYSIAQTITADGERWSTYRSYLKPAMCRSNLRVETFATARRVLLDDKDGRPRATGVEYQDAAGQVRVVQAKEVVLSSGTIHSPQILMMSGIGPAEHLKELGIPVRVDLPVGEGFMDHPRAVGLVAQCDQPLCEVGSTPVNIPATNNAVSAWED
ncbi:glucose dehydrogenase [FAD, quinone]-like [Thrips palmi]|uniref:Glucose dehydrogenase [FAD, quinone]-like n=1 Tax=Thrips palmi TaxID=161013 RepID=A0A6P8Z1P9_THRPL|nr:glucose dehydrogenase [FAD, quinone]-like [Thrips palmi]XP_034243556.1 glucose dehydrogenase [FAD, quinone]-like [Thrips palmi]